MEGEGEGLYKATEHVEAKEEYPEKGVEGEWKECTMQGSASYCLLHHTHTHTHLNTHTTHT